MMRGQAAMFDAALVAHDEPMPAASAAPDNREAWLTRAVDELRPLFADAAGVDLPDAVRVSVGWPGGKSVRKVIGQCWPTKAAAGIASVFISPALGDPVDVLAVLVHELVHAFDDCEHGHKAPFAVVARAVGLTGKMTATVAGDELREHLAGIVEQLGPYPHGAIRLGDAAGKTQTTRMRKVVCESDGYTLRTTQKWLDVGVPTCPCGAEMVAA